MMSGRVAGSLPSVNVPVFSTGVLAAACFLGWRVLFFC